jgi:prepilin-type N-terminal cleavage/methylation domain-containing protein
VKRRDEAFTLVELLIAVSIMSLMLMAVTTAMIVAFRTIRSSDQGVTDSSGAQLLASYLVSDAQAANHVQPTDFTCDPTAVLELRASDADPLLNAASDVVYAVAPTPGGGSQLLRKVFRLTSTATSCSGITPTTQILVLDVDPAGTAIVCDTATCSDASNQVGLQVKAFAVAVKSSSYTAYTFKVQGTRRATS